MKDRCNNPNHCAYHRYGGRGITVCARWNKFENFFQDMGHSNGLTLERKNNDKGYSPKNCYWATSKEQNRNTARTSRITFNGVTLNLAAWAEKLGINYRTLYCRFKRGWPIAKAFNPKKLINQFA